MEIAWLQLWMQLRLVSGAHLVFVGTQDGRAESTGGILSSGGVLSGGLISGGYRFMTASAVVAMHMMTVRAPESLFDRFGARRTYFNG